MFITNVIVFLKQTIITGIIYGMQIIVHKHKYLYEIGKCNTYSFQHREVHSLETNASEAKLLLP